MKNTTDEKIITSLKSLSVRYLSRYSSSSQNLSKYLMKKLKLFYKDDIKENPSLLNHFCELVSSIVLWLENLGYINDELYAKYQGKSLMHKGKSYKEITLRMQEKGLLKEDILHNFVNIDEKDINLISAIKTIKRKKFGAYRTKIINEDFPEENPPEFIKKTSILDKEIASMYRYGFPYEIIKKVLQLSKEELEEIYLSLQSDLDI